MKVLKSNSSNLTVYPFFDESLIPDENDTLDDLNDTETNETIVPNITVIAIKEPKKDPTPPKEEEEEEEPIPIDEEDPDPKNVWIYVAIGGGVVLFCLLCLGAYIFCRLRRRHIKECWKI